VATLETHGDLVILFNNITVTALFEPLFTCMAQKCIKDETERLKVIEWLITQKMTIVICWGRGKPPTQTLPPLYLNENAYCYWIT